MKKKILFFLFLAGFSSPAQNAALDPTFGNAGISVHPHLYTAEIACLAFDDNGNIISVGYALQGGVGSTDYQLTLTKTDKKGILDNNFGTNGKVTTVIGHSEFPQDIIIQDDGKIIVVGEANLGPSPNAPATYIGFAVRYNSNGSLDTSFGTNGIYKLTSSRQFVSVMALPNGSIILGGNTSVNNEYLGILVKLNSNGTEDLQFGNNGVLPLTSVNYKFSMGEAILLNDGKIFCVGVEYSDILNHSKSTYCKIDTQGNFDTSFGTNGKVVIDLFNYNPIQNIMEYLHSAGELPNGQIVIGGTELDPFLLKINSDGSFDTTFGTNGMKVLSFSFRPRAMATQNDGKIIIGSGAKSVLGGLAYRIVRFDNNGDLDTVFNNGKGLVDIDISSGNDWLNYIKLQGNDTLVIGGSSVLNSNHNFTLARVLLDTPLSVEEPLEQFIKVYPNPCSERFFVEDYDRVIEEIKIFNNTGSLIKVISNPNQVQEVYSDFSSGIYHINIKAKDGRIMNKKMIKE